ncbi:MAG: VCBS repeat-containing protein [Agriterribacter sp.]
MIGIFILTSCGGKKNANTLFTKIPSSQSHIEFTNRITETEDYNIDTYEYLYNGGGVAVADINNDGLTDIIFTGNMTQDKIYLNKGGLQFEDITTQTGFTTRSKWKTGVAIADVNGDHLPDVYVCYSGRVPTKKEQMNCTLIQASKTVYLILKNLRLLTD